MGNQLASQTAALEYYLHDLPGTVYENSLGKGRFLKTLQCMHDEGTVVVKVYIKRDSSQSLKDPAEKLTEIRENFALIERPNVLAFSKWVETDKAGYLMRQYFVNNLYDRISTRPFLTMIEKKWIVFQLLTALTQSHFYGICHGDIKCENVMVTSWNWIYLSDFSSYKPTCIPEDNPADFSFFFDTSGRRTCYLAPERFYTSASNMEAELTPAMDIFSVGCVIAELFLEGTPIFNFAQLLSYRKGEYEPDTVISRIPDPSIQELVKHMIQRDPKKRSSAQKYLLAWSGTAFPTYFNFLHSYIGNLMTLDPDEKIEAARTDFEKLLREFTSPSTSTETDATEFVPRATRARDILKKMQAADPSKSDSNPSVQLSAGASIKAEDEETPLEPEPGFDLLLETETFISDLEDVREASLKAEDSNVSFTQRSTKVKSTLDQQLQKKDQILKANKARITNSPSVSPVGFTEKSILTDSRWSIERSSEDVMKPGTEGLIIILNIVCSFVSVLKYPSSKLTGLELLWLFSQYLDSEIRLQRIVPYVVSFLTKSSPLVRATGIRTLTRVLDDVVTFPPSDSHVFPAYILPALSKFASEEQEELVREAYAENLAQLAETAKRFLEQSQAFKQGTDIKGTDKDLVYEQSYESELAEIQEAFYEVLVEMLTKDTSTAVRKTLLSDITRLCIFFGRQKTNDFVLPLIITFLNDRHDWELRCAFFHNIVGVANFVGTNSLESFILPCIIQALTDEEEFVIDKAVNSLAELGKLDLFRKPILFDIAEKTAAMLFHPNIWIRYGVIALMSAIASKLSVADIHCFLIPLLRPFLQISIININEANLLESLKPPVSRESLEKAILSMSSVDSSQGGGRDSGINSSNVSSNTTQPVNIEKQAKTESQSNSLEADKLSPNSLIWDSDSSYKIEPLPIDVSPTEKLASIPINTKPSPPSDSQISGSLGKSLENNNRWSWTLSMAAIFAPAHVSPDMNPLSTSNISPSQLAASPSSTNLREINSREFGQAPLKFSQVNTEEFIDPFDASFFQKLTDLGIPMEEQQRLHAMKNLIRNRSRLRAGKASNLSEKEDQLVGFNNLSATITVHSINEKNKVTSRIRPTGNTTNLPGAPADSKKGRNEEWKSIFGSPSPRSNRFPLSKTEGTQTKANKGVPGNFPAHLFPPAAPDLGQAEPIVGDGLKDWAPKGILVAHLHEHKGPVNEIQATEDNLFFVSASDDGTVKVWDSLRLEKNVTNRSRLTYSQLPGKIKSICICENSHSVAAGSDQGSIHVFKIEFTPKKENGGMNRYTGLTTIKTLDSNEGSLVGVTHFNTATQSLLVYGTRKGKIHSWDLRCRQEPWVLSNPQNLGPLSTFMLDPAKNWLLTGTCSGYYTCWDLRFHLPLKSWRDPSKARIHKLMPFSSSEGTRFISTSGTRNEVAIWDVETSTCKTFFRVNATDENQPIPNLKNLETGPNTEYSVDDLTSSPLPPPLLPLGIKALLNPPNSKYLITGGDDKKLRYWDLSSPTNSSVISGLPPVGPKPRYSNSSVDTGLHIIQEFPNLNDTTVHSNSLLKFKGPALPSVNHQESILDIKAMEFPHKMLISASRDGVIKVWK